VTTISWILVTFNTKPTSPEKLDVFYRTVKPRGPGWGPVAARNPHIKREIDEDTSLVQSFLDYILALVFIYGLLLGVGHCFFLKRAEGLLLTLFVVPVTGFWLWFSIDGKHDEMWAKIKWVFGIMVGNIHSWLFSRQ
jgi:hypothetical protein